MKFPSEATGNQTRDLPACSAVLQQTEPPRASLSITKSNRLLLS